MDSLCTKHADVKHVPLLNTFPRLYKSLGDFDVLHGIFSSHVGTKAITKDALEAEERGDYAEAVRQYKDAVGCDSWADGPPLQVEEDLWEDSLLQVRAEDIRGGGGGGERRGGCVICVLTDPCGCPGHSATTA